MATKKTVKISGNTLTKVACSTSKKIATAKGKKIRKEGFLASVRPNGKSFCVYKGRRRKSTKKRK